MTTAALTLQRRDKVSLCLAKSITTPTGILKQIIKDNPDVTISQVKHDLAWMRKNSKKWLSGHALEGYVFSTQNTLEQLKDIEQELQSIRTQAVGIDEKLAVLRELRDTINMRWVMEGDGPTLMALTFGNESS